MERFGQNVAHYRRLLETATNEEERRCILKPLEEEEQNRTKAGDNPDHAMKKAASAGDNLTKRP
jgi:hypothetical protein